MRGEVVVGHARATVDEDERCTRGGWNFWVDSLVLSLVWFASRRDTIVCFAYDCSEGGYLDR